jgi:hypothetical protein
MKIDLKDYTETELSQLVDSRWNSSSELWEKVDQIYKVNTAIVENRADWLQFIPERRRKFRVQANRVFPNMEAVINSVIANPAGINLIPAREGVAAQDFARKLESFLRKKLEDRNVKEVMRMGLRNLYFARLIIIKPFWNPTIDDWDFRAIDPRNVRISKFARKEEDSEFIIEKIEDNLCAVIERFPTKKDALMQKYGITDEKQLYIKNPDVTYKEAWIQDNVIFKLDNIILGQIKNPYWDWDGVLLSEEEFTELEQADQLRRREILQNAKIEQDVRKAQNGGQGTVTEPTGEVEPTEGATGMEMQTTPSNYKPYFFNFFDHPRKPYIFATLFNNENSPIGRTDMITLVSELQRGIDKRKMDIDENCELANGVLKVDASVMPKSDAQRIRFETKGIIWGKGVKDGVTRETGQALPQMVFDDMIDSRQEIDNIMAASSAFRGERQGQETKAGRLALIQQSYLRLNELVQVVDYEYKEMYSWALQLSKTRYTEYHYEKFMGNEGAREMFELIQDDIENGTEVTVIAGKSLPVDDEFKFEQAQSDVEKGYISPVDYLDIAQYDNAKELSKNAVAYKINPAVAVGITPEEQQELSPDAPAEEKPPSVSISYADLPPDAQIQLLSKIGIQADPNVLLAEKMADRDSKKQEVEMKKKVGSPIQVEKKTTTTT